MAQKSDNMLIRVFKLCDKELRAYTDIKAELSESTKEGVHFK